MNFLARTELGQGLKKERKNTHTIQEVFFIMFKELLIQREYLDFLKGTYLKKFLVLQGVSYSRRVSGFLGWYRDEYRVCTKEKEKKLTTS